MARQQKPSEIIAGALRVFMREKNGRLLKKPRWNNFALTALDEDGNATYCALGALRKAAGNAVAADPAIDLIAASIPERTRSRIGMSADGFDIPLWNDQLPAGARGFRSVKAVFCRALKKAIAQEAKEQASETNND